MLKHFDMFDSVPILDAFRIKSRALYHILVEVVKAIFVIERQLYTFLIIKRAVTNIINIINQLLSF